MVTQINQAEDFVNAAVKKSEEDLKAAFAASLQEAIQKSEASYKDQLTSAEEGILKSVKSMTDQTHQEKCELEEGMENLRKELIEALIKLGEAERGGFPNIEARFNSLEASLRELERQGRILTSKISTAPTPAAQPGVVPPGVEVDAKDVAVPITPVRAQPEVFVMSSPQATIPTTSGPAEAQVPIATVQWPTPDEAQRKAEVAADPEMHKNVWERNCFDKRISKFTNDKGAQEFNDWAYELRRVTVKDENFHELLRCLEEAELEADKGNITESNLAAIGRLKSWNTAWLND